MSNLARAVSDCWNVHVFCHNLNHWDVPANNVLDVLDSFLRYYLGHLNHLLNFLRNEHSSVNEPFAVLHSLLMENLWHLYFLFDNLLNGHVSARS